MTDYGVKDKEPLLLPDINLHGMTVDLVTWQSGVKFARFYRDGVHHDAPLSIITSPQGQQAVDAIRNTFDYYKESA